MKVTTLRNTILLVTACIGLGLAPRIQAAHAADYLDALQADVADRLANVTDETTAAERRALNQASKVLDRNSKTLSADLGLLAQAATALEGGFSGDAQFATEEEAALDAYAAAAQAQLDAVNALAGTNEFPNSINNQITKAEEALARGNDSSNSVPVRAKAIAFALNKIRVADIQARRFFKAPVSVDDAITLNGRGGSGTVTLDANGTYTIPGDAGDETGTWSYERTSANTATVTLNPIGGDPRTINLKFTNSSKGTFNGTTAAGDPFRGQFTINEVE